MTSTPVSLNDESLNGSWIDINSASQIHSPMDGDSPEFVGPPYSFAESVQNLGLISFQVERFLQEAHKSSNTNDNKTNDNNNQPSTANNNTNNVNNNNCPEQQIDNISDLYMSDSDVSASCLQESKALINSLRKHNEQYNPSNNNNDSQPEFINHQVSADVLSQKLSKFVGGDCLTDQLSDSLSLLSRASIFDETNHLERATSFQDFDWLWDWTAQPQYFTGQEWKVCGPKQEYLLRRRQVYCSQMATEPTGNMFSGEMMSLLVLTNLLSIIIGAGLTYSILMRRSTP